MKPTNLGDGPRGKARWGGAVHISHRQYLGMGLLLCSVLYAQHSGVGSKLSPLASSSQVQQTAEPTIPMLDGGKGLIHLDVSVTKADGEPVSGLNREDFELLDEGLPQRFCRFTRSADSPPAQPPTQVILFVDTFAACRVSSLAYPSGDSHSCGRTAVIWLNLFGSSGFQRTVFGLWPTTI